MSEVYEAVIGLEIHVQLKTESKLFSSANTHFDSLPNKNITEVCVGMPGTLPSLNKKAVELAVKTGLSLNCKIPERSVFARKQYFYPDLPKGYQITQHTEPVCGEGYVEFFFEQGVKKVRLERAHLEEDAGKSVHLGQYSLINFNRAGVPLLEIVSRPDMRSPSEAAAFARAVRQIVLFAETSDGNLEEGNFRCDCNVSIRPLGQEQMGTRVEIKNINSFRFIEKAISYEIERQKNCKETGEEIVQETRLYDSAKNKTFSMRSKEDSADYRYFTDPDIPPVVLNAQQIQAWKNELSEMPFDKIQRYQDKLGVEFDICEILCSQKEIASYFEQGLDFDVSPVKYAFWITGELLGRCKDSKIDFTENPISAENFAKLVRMVDEDLLSGKMAKMVLGKMWLDGNNPSYWVDKLGLKTISNPEALKKLVTEVFAAHPDKVEEYKGGKHKLFGFFIGQIMKKSNGQADPEKLATLLREMLSV